MSERAYALREGWITESGYAELGDEDRAELDASGAEVSIYSGGSFAHGPTGRTVDVAGLLEEAGGVIVTGDPALQEHLEASDAFKVVARPDGEAVPVVSVGRDGRVAGLPEQEPVDPDAHSKTDLLDLAGAEGAEADESMTKAQIADAINAARQGGEG